MYEGGNGKCELQRRIEEIFSDGDVGEQSYRPQRGDCSDLKREMNNDFFIKEVCPWLSN